MSSNNLKRSLETEIEPEKSKKIKLEIETIMEEINKYKKYFNWKNEEIKKFLITFQELFEQTNNKEEVNFRGCKKGYNKVSWYRNF